MNTEAVECEDHFDYIKADTLSAVNLNNEKNPKKKGNFFYNGKEMKNIREKNKLELQTEPISPMQNRKNLPASELIAQQKLNQSESKLTELDQAELDETILDQIENIYDNNSESSGPKGGVILYNKKENSDPEEGFVKIPMNDRGSYYSKYSKQDKEARRSIQARSIQAKSIRAKSTSRSPMNTRQNNSISKIPKIDFEKQLTLSFLRAMYIQIF